MRKDDGDEMMPASALTREAQDVGWEVKVALDRAFRRLIEGLKQHPTQKPVLIFVPRGASPAPCRYVLSLPVCAGAVLLVEDPKVAMALDAEAREDSRYTVVIGTLESLAKTDADQYGTCIILAYGDPSGSDTPGVDTPKPYLYGRHQLVAKLCGWSAHLLYCEAPLLSRKDEDFDHSRLAEATLTTGMLVEKAVTGKADTGMSVRAVRKTSRPSNSRNKVCHRRDSGHTHAAREAAAKPNESKAESKVETVSMTLGQLVNLQANALNVVICCTADYIRTSFAQVSRRATSVVATAAGYSRRAAACYYVQLLRSTGSNKHKGLRAVATYVAPDEYDAMCFYRKRACDQTGCTCDRQHSRLLFMTPDEYGRWLDDPRWVDRSAHAVSIVTVDVPDDTPGGAKPALTQHTPEATGDTVALKDP